jgi:GNAT superfamily N-acetyltransferase
MNIRAATVDDNTELIELQGKCPQGTTIVASTVNTPDFFARAKVYEGFRVFVVCDDSRIIASAACGLRKALINGKTENITHEFQAFVDPAFRGKRIAGELHKVREEYARRQGAALSYGIIMEGNTPSVRHTERQGFRRCCTLIMPSIAVYKEMEIGNPGNIRIMLPEDLPAVARLVNDTWQGYELYEPMTGESLARLISRTPAYDYENICILEEDGEIKACLGYWDWSKVTRVTVEAFNLKMRVIIFLIRALGLLRPVPCPPKLGETMKQIVLSPVGFKEMRYLTKLLRHINNQALSQGIEQIFLITDRKHPLMSSLQGLIHIDTGMHLYIKPLRENLSLGDRPFFISGLDL